MPAQTPSPAEVRQHLAELLASPRFKRANRLRQFLSYVVEETLAGRSQSIKAYNVAVDAFGLAPDFDPQTNPLVRMQARKLRKVLGDYYAANGKDSAITIEIPKGGYVPIFHAGLAESKKGKAIAATTAPGVETAQPSIAVIPLVNLSGDEAQDYFAGGLTEELTAELARFQDFKVIAAQSTMRYKGQEVDPSKAGRDLGARFLLIGSVRRDEQSVKVAINLLDAIGNSQIWGTSYKSALKATDLIELQEEIAAKVVGVIADHYGFINRKLARESRRTAPAHFQAYEAVLSFYHYETELTPDAYSQALAALERAVELDPDYSLAWSMLGHLHADNHALRFVSEESSLELALIYASKGVALAPENQFAHDALTLVHFHRGDKVMFLQHVQETISLNPNSPYIVGVAGWHMMLFGEWDKGRTLLEKGMQLNPYHPTWFHLATFMDCFNREDYDSAYAEALNFNYPELFWDPVTRVAALASLGRAEEAKRKVNELLELVPDFPQVGRRLIGNYVKVDELVEKVTKALVAAGLELEKSPPQE